MPLIFCNLVIILLSCSVACGFAHSLVVVDRTNVADQLDQVTRYYNVVVL